MNNPERKQTYTENELIDFVNWYIQVHRLDSSYELENRHLIDSFNEGDEPNKWHQYENMKGLEEFIRVPSEMVDTIQSLVQERKRQDSKWGIQNHEPHKWNTILMEEVGEVAKSTFELSHTDDAVDHLIEELIQTGAVVIAYIDYLKRREQENENADNAFLSDLKHVLESYVPVQEADIDEYLCRGKMEPEALKKYEHDLQEGFLKFVLSKTDVDTLELFMGGIKNDESLVPQQQSFAVLALDPTDFQDWVDRRVPNGVKTRKKVTYGNSTYYCVSMIHDCIAKRFNGVAGTERAKENKNHDYLLDMVLTHMKQTNSN